LAQILASGTMTLYAAMRCATDIAAALREIHEHGRAHGKVVASNVLVGPKGSELLPSRTTWDEGDSARDTREFGALLFHMLTGAPLRPGDLPTPVRRAGPRSSPAGLRASALQVAADCFKEDGSRPTMQQVLTELRLLSVLLKMPDMGEQPEPPMLPPPSAPFLVAPVHFPLKKKPGTPSLRPAAPLPTEPEGEADPAAVPAEGALAPVVPLGPDSFGHPSARQPSEISRKGIPCPKCHSHMVHVSHARSRFEQWLTRMKVPICRCHSCYHRYFVFAQFKIPKEMPASTPRKKRPKRRKR